MPKATRDTYEDIARRWRERVVSDAGFSVHVPLAEMAAILDERNDLLADAERTRNLETCLSLIEPQRDALIQERDALRAANTVLLNSIVQAAAGTMPDRKVVAESLLKVTADTLRVHFPDSDPRLPRCLCGWHLLKEPDIVGSWIDHVVEILVYGNIVPPTTVDAMERTAPTSKQAMDGMERMARQMRGEEP